MNNLRRPAALAVATTGAMLAGLLTPLGSAAATVPLPAPALVAPADAAAPALKAPVLRWSAVTGAEKYEVQVSPSEDWGDPANIPLDSTVVSTQYAPSILLPHASYFWRVRSIDGVGVKGAWSDAGPKRAWTFTNGWAAAPTTVGTSGILGPVRDIQYSWTPVLGASFYEFQMSREAAFPDPSPLDTVNQSATATCVTTNTTLTPMSEITNGTGVIPGGCSLPADFANGTWFWRVRAHDGTADAVVPVSTTPATSGITHDPPVNPEFFPFRVTGVSPLFGKAVGGDEVTVTGNNFVGATAVWFGSTRVAILPADINDDGTSITVTSPAGALGTVYVFVERPGLRTDLTPKGTFTFGTLADVTPPAAVTAVSEASAWSATASYSSSLTNDVEAGDYRDLPPVASVAVHPMTKASGLAGGSCLADVVTGTPVCDTTPTISWTSVPATRAYRVTIGLDAAFTNVQRRYETGLLKVTPREVLPDNQAGNAYYVAVQPCTNNGCAQATVTSFRKRAPRAVITGGTGNTLGHQIELTWAPLFDSATSFDVRSYHVQVAADPDFDTVVDDVTLDRTSYVREDTQYPLGRYYWRVQGIDQSSHAMPWSAPNRDVNDPATFLLATVPGAPGQPFGTPGDGKVTLSWDPPATDSGVEVSGYTVTASPGGLNCATTSTTCTVTSLTNGTPYTFTVTATNVMGAGPASPASGSVAPRVPATPPGPSGPSGPGTGGTTGPAPTTTVPGIDAVRPVASVKALTLLTGALTVSWSEPVKSGLLEIRSDNSVVAGTVSQAPTSWTFRPQTPWVAGQSYVVTVTGATDMAGNPPIASSIAVRATPVVDSASAALHRVAGDKAWSRVTSSDARGKTVLRSSDNPRTPRKSKVWTFVKGSRVQVWACKSPTSGDATLLVDGKRIATLHLYRSYSGCGLVYNGAKKLANKVHVVTLMVSGHKPKQSKGYDLAVDALGVR